MINDNRNKLPPTNYVSLNQNQIQNINTNLKISSSLQKINEEEKQSKLKNSPVKEKSRALIPLKIICMQSANQPLESVISILKTQVDKEKAFVQQLYETVRNCCTKVYEVLYEVRFQDS